MPNSRPSHGILDDVGRDSRGLVVGLGVIVALAVLVGVLGNEGQRPGWKPHDVVVASSPGAHVPLPSGEVRSGEAACTADPSTGQSTVFYRVHPNEEWAKIDFNLCNPPGFRPGAVALNFRSPHGAVLEAVIPFGGWTPHERRPGTDAQIGLVLPGGPAWRAWDAALPCRVRTQNFRRFMAPITAFWGERMDGNHLVGASVRALVDCSGIPLSGANGMAVDLSSELTVQNCEGVAAVVPAPALSPRCDRA